MAVAAAAAPLLVSGACRKIGVDKKQSVQRGAHCPPALQPGHALAADLTVQLAGVTDVVSDSDLQAFAVLLGGSGLLIAAVLSLVIGSNLFVKDLS